MTDPDQPPVTLILDRTALLAYAAGNMDAAEPVGQVIENRTRYGVPIPAAVEALAVVPGAERAALDWLLHHPACAVLTTWGEDWEEMAFWHGLTGRYDAAAALLCGFEHDADILASDTKAYPVREGLPVIYFPA